ncbi:MAG: hypothetical protein ACLSVG_05385 [Clostridia bacterium]
MKKRILSFIIMTAVFVASFSALAAFAATEALDLRPETLREINGAAGKEDSAETASGDTYSAVGRWDKGTGVDGDFLVPFAEDWPDVGEEIGETHIIMMNYNGYILIAKDVDLSKYSKAVITYSTDKTFVEEENEIGFFSKAAPFGFGPDRKTDGLIASGLTTSSNGDAWLITRDMEIDLSNVDYKGDLYLAYYMKNPNGVCVTAIEFTLKDGTEPAPSDPSPTPSNPDKKPNTNTGDMNVVFIIAAAAVVLSVVFKKKSVA